MNRPVRILLVVGTVGVGDATPGHELEPGTWGPEEADQLIGDGGWSNPAGRERRPP